MGKPYEIELKNLTRTYEWALHVQIEGLCSFVKASQGRPLIAIGSGGSLTVAHMAALLHERTGVISKGITPLDFISSGNSIRDANVLIISAGGKNPDILSAFRFAASSEPRQLMALCMKAESPLANLSKKFRYTQVLDFGLPSGKDGFLATNSLLAFIIILIRAYEGSFRKNEEILPKKLLHRQEFYEELKSIAEPFVEKNTWVVLYGGWGFPVAIDAESKFTEAALTNVQISDYRNFAHGRHHWLAKRGAETGIVALMTPDEREIASRTLKLLPSNIPSIRLNTDKAGPMGTLELLIKLFYLVHFVGSVRGIDPGMPGVPFFGRRIYNLRLPSNHKSKSLLPEIDYKEGMAIIRKSKCTSLLNMKSEDLRYWRNAYRTYMERIEYTSFGAVVFDYDGTLCDPHERFSGLPDEIVRELVRLLRGGIIIGIATGRGKSVRADLQRSIPREYWQNVMIGYYNGSDIGPLDDSDHPDKTSEPYISLQLIKDSLEKQQQFQSLARLEIRPKQITVEPLDFTYWGQTNAVLLDIVTKMKLSGIQILESTHSIDILAPGVSKRDLVSTCEETAKKIGNPGDALCIGDKGEWPGNDYEFLSTPYGLSVDAVSPAPDSCWNLSQAGHRGVQATLNYLRHISMSGTKHFGFSLNRKRMK